MKSSNLLSLTLISACLAFVISTGCGTTMTEVGCQPACPSNQVCNQATGVCVLSMNAVGGGGGSDNTGGGTANTGGGTANTGGGTANTGGGTGGGTASTVGYCGVCTSSMQCGAGNLCLRTSATATTANCGSDCGAGQACPSGSSCVNVTNSSGASVGHNCFPTSGSCTGTGTGGGTGSGTGGGAGACTQDTWANFAGAFFANECASCHHHTGEFDAAVLVGTTAGGAFQRINSGNMPQGTALSASTKARILAWYRCGKP